MGMTTVFQVGIKPRALLPHIAQAEISSTLVHILPDPEAG